MASNSKEQHISSSVGCQEKEKAEDEAFNLSTVQTGGGGSVPIDGPRAALLREENGGHGHNNDPSAPAISFSLSFMGRTSRDSGVNGKDWPITSAFMGAAIQIIRR